MSNSSISTVRRLAAPKAAGNPEGKGAHAFLDDRVSTEPRGVVSKPQRHELADLFTELHVLSASFKYRPVPGRPNYLYWMDGEWSLSLIAPYEWSEKRRAGFAGTCILQPDMTWTIAPSDRLSEEGPASAAVRRFFDGFAGMLDTNLTLEDILPYYAGRLPYYQRLLASAMSRSMRAAVTIDDRTAISCREWQARLPRYEHELLAYSG
mgnify:CR=1 FL=1